MSSPYFRSGYALRRGMRQIFEKICRFSVGIESPSGIGTGIVLCVEPTIILTARHVIGDATETVVQRLTLDWRQAKVRTTKDQTVADVVMSSVRNDIVLLLCRTNLPQVESAIISPQVRPLIGTPLYRLGRDKMPLAAGYLFVNGRDYEGSRRLIVSMITDSGASGGPICDKNGRVIGIVLESEDDEEMPQAAFALRIHVALATVLANRDAAKLLKERLLYR